MKLRFDRRLISRPRHWLVTRMDARLLLILIGVIVGIASGVAAVILNRSLEGMSEFFHHYRHYWWAFLLPAVGAAGSALFLDKIVKEGAGHGVPEVIYAVSRYGGLIRLRSTFSRIVSSCLTIGTGGSAGPEAPIVMSGAAIGSNIAQFFGLNDRQRITLVGCGTAGAIGSIFNAPIAGMIFTMEVVLGEWTSVSLVPIAIAAVTGTEVSRMLRGNQIPFESAGFQIHFHDTIACIGLAVVTAAVSILLTRSMKKMHGVSEVIGKKTGMSGWMKAATGGCMVGLLGIGLPVVLGEGYHAIHEMIGGVYTAGLAVVVVGIVAKILATALTLGWGGSGGIFAPCLVIGSFSGLAYHRGLVMLFPGVEWVGEGCFALLGMAGLLAGILQAPLTGIFLILEITGSYEVMLPLMVVSAFSTTLCRYVEPASFYLRDLVERGQLLRPGTDGRVLADLRISELIERDCTPVRRNMLLREFLEVLKHSKRNFYPVEDDATGRFVGMMHLDDVRPYLLDTVLYETVFIDQIMHQNVTVVHPDDELRDVLAQMDAKGLFSMPVVVNHRFVGMISKATLLDQYRKELMVQTSDS